MPFYTIEKNGIRKKDIKEEVINTDDDNERVHYHQHFLVDAFVCYLLFALHFPHYINKNVLICPRNMLLETMERKVVQL